MDAKLVEGCNFRPEEKAGHQLEKSWSQLLQNVEISWALQVEAACRHFGGVL
jgi:hypothetical protein